MIKRIAFLGYNEPDGKTFGNGVARVIYNQAQILKERGYEVLYYHLFSKKQYKGLNRFLKENAIDVAVWHMTSLKVKGRLHTPCPLICLWHSSPFFKRNLLHGLFNGAMFTYVTACADKMVLLSEGFVKRFFPAKLFPKKVMAIPNFLSDELIHQEVDLGKKKKEVLFVGRLDNKVKRIDLLLRVWSKIEEVVSDWSLNICGEGADELMLKQMDDDLDLKHVCFRGYVNPGEFYKTASVFCMTSAIEGMPMVIEEAAAYGCAPMAFNSFESVSDMITDGENGRLIRAFDIDAYASTLMELMNNESLRLKLAKNAKNDVERFSPEKIMNQWERLYNEVIKT